MCQHGETNGEDMLKVERHSSLRKAICHLPSMSKTCRPCVFAGGCYDDEAMAICIARLLPLSHQQQPILHRPLPKHLVPVVRRTHSPRKSVPVRETIQLTDLERKIFSTLKAVVLYFGLKTQVRVAGGWVRDKLLGGDCNDIDIAIDDMLGRAFCRKVYRYLRSMGLRATGYGVIRSNPLTAKHLEVARMQMFGVLIDFVNLRPEKYSGNSSMFVMQDFGTATEDAYGRDLTINSLFYNINTSMVEDPTGRGISDLKAGIIATPLHAKSTFLDDPLRVLRAIRFVGSLDYELHEEIKIAAVDNDVMLAFASKISRERIGREVDRMFMSAHPVKAIKQLVELQLFPVVFSPPPDIKMVMPEFVERSCLNVLEAVWEVMSGFGISKLTVEQRRICLLGAFLWPVRNSYYDDPKNRMVPVSSAIIKESLKMRAADAAKVALVHKTAKEFSVIGKIFLGINKNSQNGEESVDDQEGERWSYAFAKYRAGQLLRELGGLWHAALLLSSVLEKPEINFNMSNEDRKSEIARRSNQCISVGEQILRLQLEETHYCSMDGRSIVEDG